MNPHVEAVTEEPDAYDPLYDHGYIEHAEVDDHTNKDKPPRLSITSIRDTRNKIRGVWQKDWLDAIVTPVLLKEQILPAVASCLSKNFKPEHTFTTLTWHLNGVRLTDEVWDYLATRLAGNLPRMRRRPLTASTAVNKGGWVLLETLEAELYRSKARNIGAMFLYRIKTGLAAGEQFRQFLPMGFLPHYGKNLGAGKARWWKRPRLYVAMNTLGYLEPAKTSKQLYIAKYRATASCQDINRFYAKGRSQECIHHLQHSCWVCPRGLLAEDSQSCVFATHRYPWIKRSCQRCGQLNWFYRHWQEGSPCIRCREAPLRRMLG